MAEYRVEFEADASRASRTISLLEKAIKEVTKEFKQAEIGSESFIDAGLQIGRLTKEVTDAKGAIVNVDRAQRQFNQALEAGNKAFGTAIQAAQKYNDGLQKLANESYQKQQGIRDKNFRDEVDDWDRRLKVAVAASSKIAKQQQSIMEFRAGMGARGAIPAVASPIRGGAAFPGSPEYNAIQQRTQAAAARGAQVGPSPQAFAPGSLASYESKLKALTSQARLIAPNTTQWRELNKEILQMQRSIDKINKMQGAGPTAQQRLGAAGGAFLYGGGLGGGVGSALGGVAGGLAGGVPGAFTGAALGQLADNLGTYAAAMASTVAEVNKARTALAGVTKNAEDYDSALSSVTASSKKFLLPIVDATQQFTKLQASVVGAGYDTTVTTKAFNAIGAAVVATGGNAEDLNGALRATSQVFSKGKVSAEELRQQIGERLPGAFTIFAQSIGKTPEQLDKLLEEGKVTLNDFIKFLEELDKRYGSTAELLAKAPENAGARLKVALQAATVAFGGFFQKVGAGFQGYLTDLVNFVLKNQEQVKRLIAAFAVAAQDIYTIFSNLLNGLAPLFTNFFQFIFTNFAKGVNALASLAEQSRASAGGPEKRAAAAVEQLYAGRPLAGHFGQRRKAYEEALRVEMEYEKGASGRRQGREARVNKMAEQMFTPFRPTQFGAGIGGGAMASGGGVTGKGPGSAAKQRASRLPELTEELNLAKQLLVVEQQISMAELGGNQLAVVRLNGIKEQLRIQSEIAKVRLQQDVPLAEKQMQIDKLRVDSEKQRLQTNFEIQQKIQSELQSVQNAMTSIATTAAAELEDRKQYERLVAEGLAPALAEITIEVQRQFANEVAKLKALEIQIQAEIDILTAKQNQTSEDRKQLDILRERLGLVQGGIADAPALAGEVIQSRTQKQLLEERPKSSTELITEASKNAQNELAKLTSFGHQAVEGAKAIGGAFAQAFKDVASGSMTAQEALANMMQSIASHFLEMAAQIIAQQMTMIILGTIMKALGVAGGGGGGLSSAFGSSGPQFNPAAFSMPRLAAEGAYWQGGFQAFADGGVVNGPTLGLIGEGGEPEYVIPASKMSGAMARYSAGARGNAVIPAEGGEGISSMSIGAPTGAIDVRYSVERINSVDYVTADQFQRGMAQAAQQGAKQGEQMTLRRLQQSRSTRGRLGLN